MRNIEILVPESARDGRVLRVIDLAVAQAGLTVTLRGSLKNFDGCTHWHAKLGRQRGTLEVTYWPHERRAWFTIQDGRVAPWIEGKMLELAAVIGKQLGYPADSSRPLTP